MQERGEIFFFCRPKVGKDEAHSSDDVKRLYIVLRPKSGERPVEEKQDPHSGKEGSISHRSNSSSSNQNATGEGGGRGSKEVNIEKQPLLRLIVMGKKSLPDPSKKSQPYWGFVELVTTSIDDVKASLKGEEYDTSTRGHRRNPDAIPIGKGIYRILRHKKGSRTHTHLVYKLEFPPNVKEIEPKESLNVEHEGSYVIQIKNPDQPAGGGSRFRGLQQKRKATFPAHLQGQFGKRRFVQADPPDFLNYEGCELLLISASDDVEEELGLELRTQCERDDASCSDLLKTFGETPSTAPLLQGT